MHTLIKFFIPFILVTVTSCSQNLPPKTEFVLGTVCTINLYDKGTNTIYSEVFSRLQNLEAILSANRTDTNIAEINNAAGLFPVKAAPETITILEEALFYCVASNGAFDPTVGPLVKTWNIGTDYAAIPTPEAIQMALSLIDYQKIILDKKAGTVFLTEKGMKLDFGAIAKGFATDEIVQILKTHNINKAIIDLGGNVFALGSKTKNKPWNIGIRNPEISEGSSIITIPITNKSIVTSGIYERFFEQDGKQYHHILDINTGFPVQNDLLSVTIISTHSIQGDALSTTAFLLGTERGLELIENTNETEAIFINKNHQISISSGLQGRIKITDPVYSFIPPIKQ